MNEVIFLLHSFAVFLFLSLSFYLGKEALFACIAACWLFANFFVSKQIMLFGLHVTASDVYAIGGILGLSVLQEYWGRECAKKAFWTSFTIVLFVVVSSFFHLAYKPSSEDMSHASYQAILSPQLRLFIASLASFALCQFLEISLFKFFKEKSAFPFFIRAALVGMVVQFVDTVLFSYLALYTLVHSVVDVIVMSYTVKLLLTLLTLPFFALIDKLIPSRIHVISSSRNARDINPTT